MSEVTNAINRLVQAAIDLKAVQPPEHPRIRSGMVAEEIATALAELMSHIDMHLGQVPGHTEMDPSAMERYPLLTSFTWIPPSKDRVHSTGVGAAFELSTLVGPQFTILVMPTMVMTSTAERSRALEEAAERFSRANNGMGAP